MILSPKNRRPKVPQVRESPKSEGQDFGVCVAKLSWSRMVGRDRRARRARSLVLPETFVRHFRPAQRSGPTTVHYRRGISSDPAFGFRSSRRRREGSILIVVLWVVLILSLMVSSFAVTMHIETRLTGYHERELQAKALALGGLEYVKALLVADLNPQSDVNADTAERRSGGTSANPQARSSTKGADYYSEPWRNNLELTDHQLGEGTFTVQIIDEQSKLCVNALEPENWRALLRLCGVDTETASIISDSITDWVDTNSTSRPNGAEDEFYMSLSSEENGPYHCKNGAIDKIEELLLIRGITPDIFYGRQAEGPSDVNLIGIGRFLTTMPFSRVNMNTASSEVLQCLPGVTADMADRLIRYRQGDDGVDGTDDDKPFESWDEVATVWSGTMSSAEMRQMRRFIDVKSNYFTVRSTGVVGNTRKTILTTLVRSEDGTVAPVTWDEHAR